MNINMNLDISLIELAENITSQNSWDDILSFISAIDLSMAEYEFTVELISRLQSSLDEENWSDEE